MIVICKFLRWQMPHRCHKANEWQIECEKSEILNDSKQFDIGNLLILPYLICFRYYYFAWITQHLKEPVRIQNSIKDALKTFHYVSIFFISIIVFFCLVLFNLLEKDHLKSRRGNPNVVLNCSLLHLLRILC